MHSFIQAEHTFMGVELLQTGRRNPAATTVVKANFAYQIALARPLSGSSSNSFRRRILSTYQNFKLHLRMLQKGKRVRHTKNGFHAFVRRQAQLPQGQP